MKRNYILKPANPIKGELKPPTVSEIAAVTDVLEHKWSSNALLVQERYTQAIERDDHNAASKWALASAISTDKVLVLKGRPTEIVGHVHQHRHELGKVMDKLANALRPDRYLGLSQPAVGNPSSPVNAFPPNPIMNDGSVTSV